MHPPVHRVLGWVSKPSAFGARRLAWRLNQLRGLTDLEVLVQGEPAETEQDVVERLPSLIEAVVLDRRQQAIGTLADAAIELRTGRILHYLVSRSDPRLPGSSRWRLSLDRLVDQQPGQVLTALESLDDLPLARASVRQELLRRSRRWRDQVQEAGSRFEERLEGWLEEPPWDSAERQTWQGQPDRPEQEPRRWDSYNDNNDDNWDNWPEPIPEPIDRDRRPRRSAPSAGPPPEEEDPWL
jgi:hypothetical protein